MNAFQKIGFQQPGFQQLVGAPPSISLLAGGSGRPGYTVYYKSKIVRGPFDEVEDWIRETVKLVEQSPEPVIIVRPEKKARNPETPRELKSLERVVKSLKESVKIVENLEDFISADLLYKRLAIGILQEKQKKLNNQKIASITASFYLIDTLFISR